MNDLQVNKGFFIGSKVIFIILLLYGNSAFSHPGWDKRTENSLTAYTPKDLKVGETVAHFVYPAQPAKGDDKEEILLNFARQIEKRITGGSGKWDLKQSKVGDFSASKVMDYKGKTLLFLLHIISLPNDKYYIIQSIADNDNAVKNKYLNRLNELVGVIGDPTHTSKEAISKNNRPGNAADFKRPKMTKAASPKGLKELRGTMEYGIQPAGTYGLTGKVVALFDDDSFTRKLGVVFSKGTERAKKENPEIWGKWRLKGKKLELKDAKDSKFGKTYGNWVAEPGKKDMKLKGCYGNITSSSGGMINGITKGQSSSWCFNPDGRFAYGAAGYGTQIFDVDTSKRGMSKAGYYRIDKYAAHFIFDDGTDITTAFCFLDDEKEHIAINGKRLMLNY
ncbi:MAG: hypothetical protein ABW098_09350 [Candidatus Thiodiazotropha sp.]